VHCCCCRGQLNCLRTSSKAAPAAAVQGVQHKTQTVQLRCKLLRKLLLLLLLLLWPTAALSSSGCGRPWQQQTKAPAVGWCCEGIRGVGQGGWSDAGVWVKRVVHEGQGFKVLTVCYCDGGGCGSHCKRSRVVPQGCTERGFAGC
jgi:hypothetical protein